MTNQNIPSDIVELNEEDLPGVTGGNGQSGHCASTAKGIEALGKVETAAGTLKTGSILSALPHLSIQKL